MASFAWSLPNTVTRGSLEGKIRVELKMTHMPKNSSLYSPAVGLYNNAAAVGHYVVLLRVQVHHDDKTAVAVLDYVLNNSTFRLVVGLYDWHRYINSLFTPGKFTIISRR